MAHACDRLAALAAPIDTVEDLMLLRSRGPLLASTLLPVVFWISACGTTPEPEAPPPPSTETSTPQRGGGVTPQTIDTSQQVQAEAEERGFFARLARRLGSDRDTPNAGPCPAVRVLYDASRFVELMGPERFENVGFTGEINSVNSACRYIESDPIEIQLELDMAFGRGPKADGFTKDVVYWVATTQVVSATDPITGQPRIIDVGPINRARFTHRVEFPESTEVVSQKSAVTEVTIPRAGPGVSGTNFEVIVGFELTDEQLQFNRDGKRFRLSE